MKIEVELPMDLEGQHYDAVVRAAREAAILRLYDDGVVSMGRAAEILGMGLETFLKTASARGIPVLRACDCEGDIEAALDAAWPH